MKQHITVEQLNQLSEKGKEKLREWWEKDIVEVDESKKQPEMICFGYKDLPLLSIGQMIEFLIENNKLEGEEYGRPALPTYNHDWEKYICDDLWEAVKEALGD